MPATARRSRQKAHSRVVFTTLQATGPSGCAPASVTVTLNESEGPGFARKENADFRCDAMVRFIETVLLKQP